MGRWSAAREDSQEVISSGALDGSIWQHLGLALVALRVGDEDAGPHLERGWSVALTVDEPMRYLPMLSAIAEQMWLTGRPDQRVTEWAVDRLSSLGATAEARWAVGDLLVWFRRLGIEVDADRGPAARPTTLTCPGSTPRRQRGGAAREIPSRRPWR